MVDNFVTQSKNDISEKTIILKALEKVAEKFSHEFRGGYETETLGPNGQIIRTYIPDSRAEASQSIEVLAILLIGFFDKEMKDKYNEYQITLKTLREDKKLSKEEYTIQKLRVLTEEFSELNLLLKRLDYLATSTFVEKAEEEDDDN